MGLDKTCHGIGQANGQFSLGKVGGGKATGARSQYGIPSNGGIMPTGPLNECFKGTRCIGLNGDMAFKIIRRVYSQADMANLAGNFTGHDLSLSKAG